MTPDPTAQPTGPLDFTNQYNTPLPAGQQDNYNQWAKAVGQDPVKGRHDYDLQGAFLGGAQPSANSHLPDDYKKPNHATFSNESIYNGIDGYVGGKWTDQTYQPSITNLNFRSQPQLQQYFDKVEPDIKLLAPAPVPQPSGTNGQYQISDFAPSYRAKTATPLQAPQPVPPRKFYGQ